MSLLNEVGAIALESIEYLLLQTVKTPHSITMPGIAYHVWTHSVVYYKFKSCVQRNRLVFHYFLWQVVSRAILGPGMTLGGCHGDRQPKQNHGMAIGHRINRQS